MTKKSLNIGEVAKLCGVSKTTVSMVFNDNPRIPQKTKEKVLEVAKKFGYEPSMVARSLRSKKTKTIGLMLPSITDPFFPQVVKGVEDAALEKGYSVIFCNFDEKIEKESLYFQMFEKRWVDGIVFSGVSGGEQELNYIEETQKKGISIVFIDRGLEGHFDDAVMIDNEKAAYKGTKYLLDLTHRRIGFISGPTKIGLYAKRLEGYKKALRESEIELDESLIVQGKLSSKTAEYAVRQFLSQTVPTAIFTMDDVVAIAVLGILQKRSLKVPEDISVMGFDNILLASLVNPSLTTIAQPMQEMGRQALNLLIDRIERKDSPKRKIILDTKVVVRESTAKAK